MSTVFTWRHLPFPVVSLSIKCILVVVDVVVVDVVAVDVVLLVESFFELLIGDNSNFSLGIHSLGTVTSSTKTPGSDPVLSPEDPMSVFSVCVPGDLPDSIFPLDGFGVLTCMFSPFKLSVDFGSPCRSFRIRNSSTSSSASQKSEFFEIKTWVVFKNIITDSNAPVIQK